MSGRGTAVKIVAAEALLLLGGCAPEEDPGIVCAEFRVVNGATASAAGNLVLPSGSPSAEGSPAPTPTDCSLPWSPVTGGSGNVILEVVPSPTPQS